MQLTDNAGVTDEYRPRNYPAVRYPAIYAAAAEAHALEFSLSGIEVRLSRLNRMRKVVNSIFSYTNCHIAVSKKYFVRVNATEELPFLVINMSPYVAMLSPLTSTV
jgi:hypothetical protein